MPIGKHFANRPVCRGSPWSPSRIAFIESAVLRLEIKLAGACTTWTIRIACWPAAFDRYLRRRINMFRHLRESDLQAIADWWQPQPIPFVDCPNANWWNYVATHSDVMAYGTFVEWEESFVPVCYSQNDLEFDQEIRTASLAIVTAPRCQRQGFARRHFELLKPIYVDRGVDRIAASISVKNEGSSRFFNSLGFRPCTLAPDRDGLLEWEYWLG